MDKAIFERYNMDELYKLRNALVAQDNRLIQDVKQSLTGTEVKAVSYLITKIKKGDTADTAYVFSFNEFAAVINWSGRGGNYEYIKGLLTGLADKSWWIPKENGGETLMRWFNIVDIDPEGNGENKKKVTIKFHERVFPYISDLAEQKREKGIFYTGFKYQNITLMKNKYSIHLYRLLKTYDNGSKATWIFEVGTGSDLDIQTKIGNYIQDPADKKHMPMLDNPSSWKSWSDFKRYVLEPSVEEINKYSDIKVTYTPRKCLFSGKKTKKVSSIVFVIERKNLEEQKTTDEFIDREYETTHGEAYQYELFDYIDMSPSQVIDVSKVTIESLAEEYDQIYGKSIQEDKPFAGSEEKEIQDEDAEMPENLDKSSKRTSEKYEKIKSDTINMLKEISKEKFTDEQLSQIYDMSFSKSFRVRIEYKGAFVVDYVSYYLNKILATPEETKSNTYYRLYNYLKNDYDNQAEEYREIWAQMN